MPADDSPLNDKARELLSARADDFNAALRKGRAVDWEEYVGDLSGSTRVAVLVELVHIDLEHRSKAGDSPRLEEYVRRFPDLGPAAKLPGKLIVEEFRLRAAAGETPTPDEYRGRFPDQFESVRASLESIAQAQASRPKPGSGVHALELGKGVAQQYEFIKQLGRGMFGEVWLAKKNPSGIEKAVKILLQPMDMDGAQRELRSLELIKNLRHPYLLATEDFWVSDGRLHIAMELADSTVKQRLKSCIAVGMPALPPDEAIQYVAESAEGLDYLHEHKVLHRDVKPDNILLLRGHAKVADFGLARQQDQAMASMTFAGTPAYMAPEVWGGEGGPASDQYSLALLYAELRQGRSLLKVGPMSEMMLAHLDGRFDFADDIPEEERRVVRQALAKNPADRFPTCLAFALELSRCSGRTSLRGPSMAGAMARSGTVAAATQQRGGTTAGATGVATQSIAGSIAGSITGPPSQAAAGTGVRSGTVAATAALRSVPGLVRPGAKKPGPPKKLVAGILATVMACGIGLLAWLFAGGFFNPAIVSKTSDNGGVVVPPPPPPTTKPDQAGPALPPGATAEPGTRMVELLGGRVAPEWVTFEVNGQTARFRLVAPPSPLKPFYILESKTWNALFENGALADSPKAYISRGEAEAFAKAKFGGRLPTPDEWDAAAGNLTLPGGTPRVNVAGLSPTHGLTDPPDVTATGLIDMAGNGWEWTSGTLTLPDGKQKAVLRGRNFTFATPLTPELLRAEKAGGLPFTQYADKGSPYTSFRVVVPLP